MKDAFWMRQILPRQALPRRSGRLAGLAILMLLALVSLSGCQTQAAPETTAAPETAAPPVASAAVAETSAPIAPAQPTTAPTEAGLPLTGVTEVPTAAPPAAQDFDLSVVNDPTWGPILVGQNGMTLYITTMDAPNQSTCQGRCAQNWPPLLVQGSPRLGPGIDASRLGTATLEDGSQMVTYNQMPLYYYAQDTRPGDTQGQGVGEVWFVVSALGEVVRQAGDNTSPAVTTAPATVVSPATAAPTSAPAATTAPVTTAAPATPAAAAAAPGQEALINLYNDPTLGPILTGNNGMTLYIFQQDEPNKSNCQGSCTQKWIPLLTQGSPTLGEGVDASLIGTAALADGSQMVTYNQMPLYFWYQDARPGDTFGQGVGEVWWVVSPAGVVIQGPAATPTVAAPTAAPPTAAPPKYDYKPDKEKKDSDY